MGLDSDLKGTQNVTVKELHSRMLSGQILFMTAFLMFKLVGIKHWVRHDHHTPRAYAMTESTSDSIDSEESIYPIPNTSRGQ
jgi:hypothetical protein